MKSFLAFCMLCSFCFSASAQSEVLPEAENGQAKKVLLNSGLTMEKGKNTPKQSLANEVPSDVGKNKENKDKRVSSQPKGRKRRVPVAGEVLYFNDFLDDQAGAMPKGWFASDFCQLMAFKPWPGHWLRLVKKGTYAPADSFILPETYTVEFDVLMFSPPEEGLGTLSVSLAAIEEENPTQAWKYFYTRTDFYVGYNYSTFTVKQAGRQEKVLVENDIMRQALGRPLHITLLVKDGRYTLFVDEEKVVDIPELMKAGHRYNRLLVSSQLSKADEHHQVLVSNFKVRAGQAKLPARRHKTR